MNELNISELKSKINNLTILDINRKPVFIVDSHHHVLPIWEIISNDLDLTFNLVTFDYHADTRDPFKSHIFSKYSDLEFDYFAKEKLRKEKMRENKGKRTLTYLSDLCHAEHIKTAYWLGIISEYHIINCTEGRNFGDEPNGYYYKDMMFDDYAKNPNNRLEDIYLTTRMKFAIPSSPLILDFDLDFFPTRKSLNPKFGLIIRELIKRSSFITIAREERYFNDCKMEKSFTVKEAELELLKLIRRILL